MKAKLFAWVVILFFAARTICSNAAESISFTRTNYHGWNEAWVCGNGIVEAIVVPEIGRILQFRFAGNETGPFWENDSMFGKKPDPKSSEWGNFGGDKSWPSPQSDWPKITPRSWPPPVAFDSMPIKVTQEGNDLVLTSAIDPDFGIQTIRKLSLRPGQPEMEVTTIYEKVSDRPLKSGIWIITQLKNPVQVYAPIPANSVFKEGYIKQSEDLPAGLEMRDRLLGLRRDAMKSTKIGTTADRLIWVGEKEVLMIEAPRLSDADYPDAGSSAEVYTNPNPNAYVELELLAPLHALKPGSRIEQKSSYHLYHRKKGVSSEDFVREILGKR